jgi:hypothetical protein
LGDSIFVGISTIAALLATVTGHAPSINVLQGFRFIDDAAGREIRSGDVFQKIFEIAIRMLDPIDDRGN